MSTIGTGNDHQLQPQHFSHWNAPPPPTILLSALCLRKQRYRVLRALAFAPAVASSTLTELPQGCRLRVPEGACFRVPAPRGIPHRESAKKRKSQARRMRGRGAAAGSGGHSSCYALRETHRLATTTYRASDFSKIPIVTVNDDDERRGPQETR